MKFIYILLITAVLVACGSDKSQADTGAKTKTKTKSAKKQKVPTSSSEELVTMTITGSDLAGKYVLKNNDIMSQMAVGHDSERGVISMNLNAIQPEDASQPKITLAKWAKGEAAKGSYEGFEHCFMFQTVDFDGKFPYRRIDGEPIGCGELNIHAVGEWQGDTHITQKRGVTGSYKDKVLFSFTNNDDSTKEQEATIEVQFALLQGRIK